MCHGKYVGEIKKRGEAFPFSCSLDPPTLLIIILSLFPINPKSNPGHNYVDLKIMTVIK